MSARRVSPIWWAAALGAGATLLVTVLPFVRFAYRSPSLHLVLETTEALIAFLAAFLFFGRFRVRGLASDLVLTYVLGLLGATNLFFASVPFVISGTRSDIFNTWAPLVTRLVGTGLLAIAPFALHRALERRTQRAAPIVAAVVGTLLLIAALVSVLTPALPDLIGTISVPEDATRPSVEGHPALIVAQLLSVVLFAAAAVGFSRRAVLDDDGLMEWVAAGCVMSTFARINYLLIPSLYTNFVYTGDVLRLAFYLLLLIGIGNEIRSYWTGLADAAVANERRRVARDLHDGLAQELVFITAQAHRLAKRGAESADLQRLAGAADRAVAESRRAIVALSDAEQPLSEALTEMAEELSNRTGASIHASVGLVDVDAAIRENVLRIAREALLNAARHAGASRIDLSLEDGDTVVLEVRDDGAGFDVEGAEARGFGLISIRERAAALGGRASIESSPGRGSIVRVDLPRKAGRPAS